MSGNKAKQTIQEARIDSVFVALEHLAVTWNAVDGLHYDGKHPWTEWTTCSRHFAIAATVIKNIGKITLNILPNMRHSPSSSEQQKWSRNLGIIFFISFFYFFIRESYIFFFIREKIASTRHTDKRSLLRTWMSEWARVREWVRPWMRVWMSLTMKANWNRTGCYKYSKNAHLFATYCPEPYAHAYASLPPLTWLSQSLDYSDAPDPTSYAFHPRFPLRYILEQYPF